MNDAMQLVLVVQSEDDALINSVESSLKINEIGMADNAAGEPSLTVLKVVE